MSFLVRRIVSVFAVVVLCGSAFSLHAADTAKTPEGYWLGELALPTGPLQISVHFARGGDAGWRGAMDVPAQGTRNLELKVVVAARRIRFSAPGIPGAPTYTGTLSDDGAKITGDFKQGNATFPFFLDRTSEALAKAGPVIAAGIPGTGLTGHWLGVLKPSANLALRVELDVRNPNPDQFDVTLISLDQQNSRMPAASLRERDATIHLEFARPVASFEGRMSADGAELNGAWTQNGHTTPLIFKRQPRSTAVQRPQEPVRPLPYAEHEARVENATAGVTLAGTLTVPTRPGPHPAVVLLSGSGPQDRDHQVAGHRTFLVLADHLTRQGIAVLRCDERGVGKSTGTFATALQSDFIADALAAIAWLRARPDIDPKRVGLIGLSEGGMIAPRVAVESEAVAFIVLLAAPGLPLDQIMIRQARDVGVAMGSTEEALAQNERTQREIFAIARSDLSQADAVAAIRKVHASEHAKLTDAQRKALNLPKAGAPSRDQLSESPWFRDTLRHDPRVTLRAVKCPVLALTGEKDLQVSAKENLPVIEAALNAGGHRRFTIKELPGLNHMLQTCRVGVPYEYAQIEETISPVALREITTWIAGITAR